MNINITQQGHNSAVPSSQGFSFSSYMFSFNRDALASKGLALASIGFLATFMTVLMSNTDSHGHKVTTPPHSGIAHENSPDPAKWALHFNDPVDRMMLAACALCAVVSAMKSAELGNKYVDSLASNSK